ncbi:hypothetical protein DAD186_11690 [Dermabacter vaginalis]|uniref:Trp biosynthesis-associated membrane protein n=1 Tax=Dermabacter vaginalis TaxID=1630135 RepID=A0A1B0ZIA2_9MICO|nr:Trp biosynthesis-associated membrane protein [Dermabacter vaginalis]ANP27719.1 hypothetical protein DAD186_11690 [Dermabacter vaginalis]
MARQTSASTGFRTPLLLVLVVAGGVAAMLTQPTWVKGEAVGLAGNIAELSIAGAKASPLSLACALVALAAAGALSLSRRGLALACAFVSLLAGIGIAVSGVLVLLDPARAASSAALEATGNVNAPVDVSASWPVVATIVCGVLVTIAGGLLVARTRVAGGGGATRTRYTRHAPTDEAGSAKLSERTDAEAWDMLSLGEDPSDARFER